MRYFIATTFIATLGLATACGGSNNGAKSSQDAAQAAPANFSEQVARGATVYGAQCAGCHGKAGQGSSGAPAVVGSTALPLDPPSGAKYRKSQFVTVADVADFVVKNMPPKAPGSLSAEDYYSVLAFDLKANGIDLGDKKLDGALAATLTIPRK
jgi:cytochrome c